MLRNVDIINNLRGVCHKVNTLETEIDFICGVENLEIFDLVDHGEIELIDSLLKEFSKAVALVEQLTLDYRSKLEEFEIDIDELVITLGNAVNSLDKLYENSEAIFELFGCLWSLCDSEILDYKQMTQPCYIDDFIDIVFEEDALCPTDF